MKTNYEGNMRKDIVDAIREGYSVSEIPDLLGIPPQALYNALSDLVKAGALIRVSRGQYKIPDFSTASANGVAAKARPVERMAKQVQLPEYMRGRAAVTLFVEQSPTEVEGVLRFELCIGSQWVAIPINGDMRICVGEEIPRWSATQETYREIGAYRLTFKDGEQSEFPHNPNVPLTIDRRALP